MTAIAQLGGRGVRAGRRGAGGGAAVHHAERGPGVVLHATTWTLDGYLGPLLVSSLMAPTYWSASTAPASCPRDTRARRTAPRTILRAVAVSGLGGALLIVAALMAAPSLTDGRLATEGLPYV